MKNLHLEHLEDLIFNGQVLDTFGILSKAISFISGRGGLTVSTKWDGAPAFVFGVNPENDRYFVGTKSVFSGKVNYTNDDIRKNHPDSPGLQDKLMTLLSLTRGQRLQSVFQGDLLFWEGNKIVEPDIIDFQANTLRYYVERKHPDFGAIKHAEIGGIVHTEYVGETLKTMEAKFGMHSTAFRVLEPRGFFFTPRIFCAEPVIDFNDEINLQALYGIAGGRALTLNYEVLDVFGQTKWADMVRKYINHCVRCGCHGTGLDFHLWALNEADKQAAKLKTGKGQMKSKQAVVDMLTKVPQKEMDDILFVHKNVSILKTAIIKALDRQKSVKIYLPSGDECGHEGYVITDPSTDITVKFVDRYTFSQANMTHDKEWKNQ